MVLVAEPGRVVEAATRLGRIGFDNVAGYLSGGMVQLEGAPELLERTERVTAGSLSEALASADPPVVVDVRSDGEWQERHIDGAMSLPLSRLQDGLDALPADRQLVVHCASDYRSSVAASLLAHAGLERIAVLVGGLAAWEQAQPAGAGTG